MKNPFSIIFFLIILFSFFLGCSEDSANILEIENIQKITNKNEKKPENKKKYMENKEKEKKFTLKKNNKKQNKNLDQEPSFIEMQYSELVSLIGPPHIKRKDYPEEVLVYKNEICVMYFFLLNNIKTKNKKINFIYIENKKNTKNDCIKSFLSYSAD